MPAFGVQSTFGATQPPGYLQSSEQSTDIEIATIKSAIGQVVEAQQKPRSITTVTIKTKGTAALSSITAGDMTGMTITSSKYSETNDDFGSSEITATQYQ